MKIFRLSIIFLILSITLTKAEPYKPKPILFVHGIDGDSKAWGVKPMYKDTVANGKNYKITRDTINKDSIMPGDSMILPKCLEKLTPIVWAWDTLGYDTSYTIPGGVPGWAEDPAYPNKTFLEIINFDDNSGSVNEMLRENKKCEEFSQSVKILYTFGNRKILSNRIVKLAILAWELHEFML